MKSARENGSMRILRKRRLWTGLGIGAVLLLGSLLSPHPGRSTPLYAARAGRTCDNCHLTPNNWENPPLPERKCSLSCQTCHVDPSGGGQRNAAGRFFERATLPMIATSPRPTQDWDRGFMGFGRHDKATTYNDNLPQGPATAAERFEPQYAPHDYWAYGRPLGKPSDDAPFQGRYGTLNADPALRIGYDLRLAVFFVRDVFVFPMQADFNAAAHPVEHVTFFGNVGSRGRKTGFADTRHDPQTPYLREAFVLLHEAPMQSFVKAGRFVPAFGLRHDDHTVQPRRAFEQDGSLPESRVTGVEVGLAPNYPYASVSWFRGGSMRQELPAWNLFDPSAGHGAAVNLGYRAEGWAVGASYLAHRRPLADGGDASSGALFAAFNPWKYWRNLPVTLQAEFDAGTRRRSSGNLARQIGFYQEVAWLVGNGVNLIVAQDWIDPDLDVRDDDAWRLVGGVVIMPVPGTALDIRGRFLVPKGEKSGGDIFMQLRLFN